jgi:uncharacterized protein
VKTLDVSAYGRWIERLATWIVNNPWRTILGCLLIAFAGAMGAQRLTFTNAYRAFFSPDNPQLVAFERIENTYTKNDNVFIVVAPKDRNVFTRETLSAVEALTTEAWKLPYALRVDSVTNFQYTSAQGDDLEVRDLVRGAAKLDEAALNNVREIALGEPLLARRLVSREAHVTAVNVTLQFPGKSENEVAEVVLAARALADKVRAANPNLNVYLTGIAMLNFAFGEAAQHDSQTLTPLSLLIIVLAVGFLLRRVSGTLAALGVIILTVAASLGLAGWLGIKLTPPSASAQTIIITLAVADAVHILTTFFQALGRGLNRKEAMIHSLRSNWTPVFITSVTNFVGFAALNFADAPPFRDLGNIVAMGVVGAWFLSVFMLPALMVILPVGRGRFAATQTVTGSKSMERLSGFVIRNRTPLLWGGVALFLVSLALTQRNQLNDVYTEYFDPSIQFRVDTDFVDKNLGGTYSLQYSLNSGRPGGIADPAYLQQVEAFTEWYRQQPETVHVASLTDIMKRLNKNMHGDDAQYYKLPDEQALSAQYLLLYEMSLPYGLDLNDQVNVDKSATRLAVTLRTLSVKDFLALEDRAQAWLKANAPGISGEGISMTMMFAHIGLRNWSSMISGTLASLLVITLTLSFAMRSLRLGLLSMIPNIMPVAVGFGIWALIDGQIGMLLAVAISMTLGIVVDDTVHLLSKYVDARNQRLSPADAVRHAFTSVGTAIWVTTIVLVAGFLVLTLSAFELNVDLGLLTAITIAAALAADYLFLPPLLMKMEERSNEEAIAAVDAAVDINAGASRG